jgi:NAD(P)-dependent dehydrogenase (short-subunit alcohol dehydrogenase family)
MENGRNDHDDRGSERRPVALVTGAGSGIGREVAAALAEAGHDLILVVRRASALEETGRRVTTRWIAVPADLTKRAEIESLAERAAAEFGRVDVLVNNAGCYHHGALETHTPEVIERVLTTNATGPAMLIALLWPAMVKQRGATIVNVSSSASLATPKRPFAYAASKCALDAMTSTVAAEGAPFGIRAFSLNPGYVETDMLRGFASEQDVPRAWAMPPDAVARVVVECVTGSAGSNGEPLLLPRRSFARRIVRRVRSALRR